MGYTAGDLSVDIYGIDNGAVDTLSAVAKKLSLLKTSIKAFSSVDVTVPLENIRNVFTGIAEISRSIDQNSINKFATFSKATSSIKTFVNGISKINSQEIYGKINSLFRGLSSSINSIDEKALNRIDRISSSLSGLTSILSKVNRSKLGTIFGGNSGGGSGKNNRNFGFFNYGKWLAIYYIGRRIGSAIANIAQHGSDYTETLNLWETAMGDNLNLATAFVDKMNEAYGISEKTLMNAQAIFKNMLTSLGQINETVAYSLSEGITQMAIDYASLYNLSFEQAFEKFQSVLAGQSRPIRNISGYDITENTLYQLYKDMGGTKTVRGLSRIEKQLLALNAVFDQMARSGAIGDLKKTMDSYANQSRVVAEAWSQTKDYAGLLMTYLLQESGILTHISGILIFITETFKAVAESMGAIQHFGGDIFSEVTDSALTAEDAISNVQGKLFEFDKFRSLKGGSGSENILGLDERLLKSLSSYDSILSNVSSSAKDFAQHLKDVSGLFDEDGVFDIEKWEEIVDNVDTLLKLLIAFTASGAIMKIVSSLGNLKLAMNGLFLGTFLYLIFETIDAFKELDYVTGTVTALLAGGLVVAWALWNWEMIKTKAMKIAKFFTGLKTELSLTTKSITALNVAMGVTAGILSYMLADELLNNLEGDAKRAVSWIMALVGAVTALTVVFLALYGTISMGTALPIIMTGVGLAVAGMKSILEPEMYATGASNIDSGTLFVAGEMGRTEAVYTGSNGKTNVANVKQMEQAYYNALRRYGAENGNTIVVKAYLDNEVVYQGVTKQAKKHGDSWA